MEGCESITCEANDCPEFAEHFTCQCNSDCDEFGNCCEDVPTCATDPCACTADGYGWSSIGQACVLGGTTSCEECRTLDGCITSTCADAGCPEYDPMRYCQCDPGCAANGNCCDDALTIVCIDPCECPEGYGWSTTSEMCVMGATTNCAECPNQDRCDSSTCADAGCPLAYNADRVCQCNFECIQYDNCCEDAEPCYEDDTLPTNVVPPVSDCIDPGFSIEGFPTVTACVSPTTQLVYLNGVDTCITAESVGLDSFTADSSYAELNVALQDLFANSWYLALTDDPTCTSEKTFEEATDDQLWITNEMVENVEEDIEEIEANLGYMDDWKSRIVDLVNSRLDNFDSDTQDALTNYLNDLQGGRRN